MELSTHDNGVRNCYLAATLAAFFLRTYYKTEFIMSIVPLPPTATKKIDTIYDIEFFIGDNDYSKTVFKVQLGASLDMIFGMVIIGFQHDTRSALKESLFGQEDIKLKVTQTTHDRLPLEELELTLIALKVDWEDIHPDTDQYTTEDTQNFQPRRVFITCVSKNAFISQYTLVNKLFGAGSGNRPIDAVKKLAENLTIPTVISEENANPEIIPQMIIPPTSFISSFKYINNKYPIYNGFPLINFIQLYNDTLTIWDLRKRMLDKADYIVKYITSGSKDENDILQAPSFPTSRIVTYYTTGPLIRQFKSNKQTMLNFYNNSFITKPKNQRSFYIEKNVEDIFTNNSLSKPGTNYTLNTALKTLRKVHPEVISSQYSDILPNTMMSNTLSTSNDITFRLTGPNYPFLRLTEVGGGIDIRSNDDRMDEYMGRYITKKTVLSFERHEVQAHYNLYATINCIRSFYGN